MTTTTKKIMRHSKLVVLIHHNRANSNQIRKKKNTDTQLQFLIVIVLYLQPDLIPIRILDIMHNLIFNHCIIRHCILRTISLFLRCNFNHFYITNNTNTSVKSTSISSYFLFLEYHHLFL